MPVSRDSILALRRKPNPADSLDVPEWGGRVFVTVMSGTQRHTLFAKGDSEDLAQAKLLVRSLTDEEGARLFTDEDAPALMEQSGVVYLAGRVGSDSRRANGFNGYSIRVSDTGGWWLNENHTTGTQTTLANGTVSAPGRNKWITLSMTFTGKNISASINGKQVAAATSSTYSAGQVGIGIEGWQTDQFADLTIRPGTGPDGNGKTLVSAASGRCLDVPGGNTTDGTQINI